jgi:hypothetical protein
MPTCPSYALPSVRTSHALSICFMLCPQYVPNALSICFMLCPLLYPPCSFHSLPSVMYPMPFLFASCSALNYIPHALSICFMLCPQLYTPCSFRLLHTLPSIIYPILFTFASCSALNYVPHALPLASCSALSYNVPRNLCQTFSFSSLHIPSNKLSVPTVLAWLLRGAAILCINIFHILVKSLMFCFPSVYSLPQADCALSLCLIILVTFHCVTALAVLSWPCHRSCFYGHQGPATFSLVLS